jgi:hypothetical protein
MLWVKVVCAALAAIAGGVTGGGLVIVAWFIAGLGASDPSAGGAYVAMAMLTSPVGILVGAIASSVFVWRNM